MIHSFFLALYVAFLVLGASFLEPNAVVVIAVISGVMIFFYEQYLDVYRRNKLWTSLKRELPPALVVGSQSESELVSRISNLWVDKEQMSVVLSEIREGVLTINSHRHVILANGQANSILEYPDGLVNIQIDSLGLPVTVVQAIDTSLIGQAYEGTWKLGSKPERRHYEVVGLPISEQQGCLLVLRDITKIRRLERVRRDFIANISHELRTPITIVRANAETLLNGAIHDKEFGPRFLSAILRNGERLSRLINDLLDLSRIEAGQYTMNIRKGSILPIISRVIETLKEGYRSRDQQIIVNISDSVWAFFDEQAFEHIVTNYIENAIKYTPEGSTITIRGVEEEDCLLLEVEDDGLGISPKHRPRLFERFYRVDKGRSRDAGGTGLGLSIVRHLAEAMGAEVGMRPSEETSGSIFWCRMLKDFIGESQKSDLA